MIKIEQSPITTHTPIEYWTQHSAVGQITVARTLHGVCYIGLGDCTDDLPKRFGRVEMRKIAESIDIERIDTLHITGTEFQMAVWRELLRIPRGKTCSYGDIAQAIGRPKAVRAVGSAVGSNPVSMVIPCHRVLRSDGSVGGYYWGLDAKRALLATEGVILK